MTFRSILLLASLSGLVAGCASTAEQVAQRNNDRCVTRGYQPNSAEFKDCMDRVETERQLRADRRHQEMVEKSANPLLLPGR